MHIYIYIYIYNFFFILQMAGTLSVYHCPVRPIKVKPKKRRGKKGNYTLKKNKKKTEKRKHSG